MAALRSVRALGDPNLTFEPRLNEKSRALAEKKRQSSRHETSGDRDNSGDHPFYGPHDAGSRLSMEAKLLAEKRLAAVEARAKALAAAHPFAPSGMSAKSRQALAEDPKLGALSFLGRQLFFAKQEEAAAAARAKAAEEERAALFKPNITKSQSVVGPRTSGGGGPQSFRAAPTRDGHGNNSGNGHGHPNNGGSGVESAEARALRLSVVDRERMEARKKLAEETYYKQFNFRPNINQVSKALGRGAQSVEELSCNPRGAEARKRAAAAEEARRKAAETFKPTLMHSKSTAARGKHTSAPKTTSSAAARAPSTTAGASKAPLRPRKENAGGNNANTSPSSSAGSHHASFEEAHHPPRTSLKDPAARLAEIHERRAAADAWRNAQLAEREMKELEGCTFSPQKASTVSKSSSNRGAAANNSGSYKQSSSQGRGGSGTSNPVVVRGLGRYLEVRDLAKKQREEKAAAEAKAARGWVSGRGRPHTGTTQPKPFHLSGPRDPAAKEKLAKEAEAKFSESYTFRPRTNESVGRAVAGALLDEDGDVGDPKLDHHDGLRGSIDLKDGYYEDEGGDFSVDWQAANHQGQSKAAPLPGYDYEDCAVGYDAYGPGLGGYEDGYDDDDDGDGDGDSHSHGYDHEPGDFPHGQPKEFH